jgi:SAM-dependent methyltransferase
MWLFWVFAAIVIVFGFVVFRGAPYVPSKKGDIKRAFDELYPLSSRDLVVDIGSGDGIVLRQAAIRGAHAVGYELNPVLVLISRWFSRNQPNVKIHLADFWAAKLPDATTVVYTFGESRDITKMANKVARESKRIGKPLHFISYGFEVPHQIPVKKIGAHYLYRFDPLHTPEAQV